MNLHGTGADFHERPNLAYLAFGCVLLACFVAAELTRMVHAAVLCRRG